MLEAIATDLERKHDGDATTHSGIGLHICSEPSAAVPTSRFAQGVLGKRMRGGGGSAKDATHFVLYLSAQTWVGAAGQLLATEVRDARAAAMPIVMIHATPDNDNGCEFGTFFSSTPGDLIQDGLYKALALAYYPPPFRHVSACLVALALGAVPSSKAGFKKPLVSMRSASHLGKKASGSELPVAVEAVSRRRP